MVCFHGIVDLEPMHIHLKKIVKFHGISATVMFPWCSLMYIRTWRTCESVIFYCRQTASGASPIQVLVWPGGKALRQWEERQRFKSTKVCLSVQRLRFMDTYLLDFAPSVNEITKWLTLLIILMQKSFQRWLYRVKCKASYLETFCHLVTRGSECSPLDDRWCC